MTTPERALLALTLMTAPALGAQAPCAYGVSEVASGSPLRSIVGIVEASPGRLVLSVLDAPGVGAGELLAVDLGTGVVTPFSSGLPIGSPGKLVLGDGGPLVGTDVVLADWNSAGTAACCTGGVLRFDQGTGVGTSVSFSNPYVAGPADPVCLDLSPGGAWVDGAVYVGDFQGASSNTPNVYRILPDTSVEGFYLDPSVWGTDRQPFDLEFDRGGAFGGDLMVLDTASGSGVPATVWRLDSAGSIAVLSQGGLIEGCVDLAFGQGGAWGTDLYLLRVDDVSAELVRVDPTGTSSSVLDLPAPTGPLAGLSLGEGGGLSFAPGRDPYVAYGDAVYRVRSSDSVESYGTAGHSASGCQAKISAGGTASASAPSGFLLFADGVEGQKDGLFFFGANGRQANAWGNGTSFQCVRPPVRRGGLQAGSGTSGGCDGGFVQDLNARWCPGCPKPASNPGAGAVVQAQFWYRDPQNTSNQTTSLSNALEFVVCP